MDVEKKAAIKNQKKIFLVGSNLPDIELKARKVHNSGIGSSCSGSAVFRLHCVVSSN